MATELVFATVESPVVYPHKLYPKLNQWYLRQKFIAQRQTVKDLVHDIQGYYVIRGLEDKYDAEVKIYDANNLSECTNDTYIGTVTFLYSDGTWHPDRYPFHIRIVEYANRTADL